MNMRILEEIGQYLPRKGRILDIACGFGLFTLYYSMLSPNRSFYAIDINQKRIEMARSTAVALGLSTRITFQIKDTAMLNDSDSSFEAAYMLDIIHHLPRSQHKALISTIYDSLVPGGVLIVKDIATSPPWKVIFTWVLDMVMSPKMPPHYISTTILRNMLMEVGFDVKIHTLRDILPYPHVLYICRKEAQHT